MTKLKCANWLFGRGLSISCNLDWSVPTEWKYLAREEKINQIKVTLQKEMDKPSIDCAVIKFLLKILSEQTKNNWKHRFITTNWDYLLQREILSLKLSVVPSWLENTHVFHLNGTIEPSSIISSSNRSHILLEEDVGTQRIETKEANMAYNKIIWNTNFVLIGMSFECEIDRFLLQALGKVGDNLPIGESSWIIVNPDKIALNKICERIKKALPRALIRPVCATLNEWLRSNLKELGEWGIINF